MEKQRITEHLSHPVSQQMMRDKIIAHLQDALKFLHNVQFQIEHSPDPGDRGPGTPLSRPVAGASEARRPHHHVPQRKPGLSRKTKRKQATLRSAIIKRTAEPPRAFAT